MPHPSSLILHPLRSLPAFIAVLGIMMPQSPLSAGDILRGGAKPNAARPGAVATEAAAVAAQQARSNAKDALSRTTQALSAVRAMQSAARSLSLNGPNNLGPDPNHPGLMLPNVPDGLGPGGLQIAGAPVGAGLPSQANVGGRAVVNIQQTAQQALLNWTTFNVGKNTTVKFDQSAGGTDVGKWIAFNKVSDPSGSPSQILGSIEAPGQVYVINQNGIIFGGSSQVNTHILVASSLPINDNLIDRGLLNNPDAQFLFSAIAQPAGTKGPTPAFTPPPLPASGKIGDVTVQAGAQLIAPTTAANVGGRVVLVGPNVTNAGTITTPDGQTILAAGLQVGFDAHSSSDPSLRGLDVYVGVVKDPASILPEYAGTATNSGLIDAPRANVTITGKSVQQLGAINSSTSVSLNGRIDLLANYNAIRNTSYDPVTSAGSKPFLFTTTGNVTLGPGSVTQILPEYNNLERVVGTALALRSQINIQGRTIYMAPQSTILAPNALVTINAGVWDLVQSGSISQSTFVNASGQIYLDHGAMINVAGSTDISAPLSDHILTVELRGAEVADSPLQRDSVFRRAGAANPTITVDLRKTGTYNGRLWYGTPLADLSGYVGLIQRTVGELTTEGGSVSFNAGGSVVIQNGAIVDVSGGFINYEGGTVKTTRVMHMGRLFEIADALPDRVYDGIFTGIFTENHARWGVTKSYTVPWMTGEHYEQPYMQGANGGSLAIAAASMALDGEFFGQTVKGPRQRSEPPDPSTLSLAFEQQELSVGYHTFSPTPPAVTFSDSHQAPADPFAIDASGDPLPLREDRMTDVFLSPSIINDRGFGIFTLENDDGDVTVPRRTALQAPPKGSITITGANIDVQGTIFAPGGAVNLTVFNISPSVAAQFKRDGASTVPPPNLNRGNFTLGSSASLSAAGLIVDDRLSAPAPLSQPLVTAGGIVSVTGYNVNLEGGSVIDVSGGVAVSAFGQRTYGNAGSIIIRSGQDPNLKAVVGGRLNLGALLLGYSGARGGSLAIQAPVIQIGGGSPSVNALLLAPDFFSQGGFASFDLTGLGEATGVGDEVIPGVSVASGTIIEPVVESYVAVLNAYGSDTVVMQHVVKPEGLRSPVNITLNAPGVMDDFSGILTIRGDLVIGARSRIQTDALGSITLKGSTVAVYGSLIAPGGTITITGGSNSSSVFPLRPEAQTQVLPTIYLAPGSLLSTAGKVLLLPDRWGNRTGSVLPGGTISVSGNILAEAGATLDVSGTTGILDLPPAYLGLSMPRNGPLGGSTLVPVTSGVTSPLYQGYTIPTRVDSNGGTLSLKGGQALFTAATLKGDAGGPTALGGTLVISSDRFYPVGLAPQDKNPLNPTLQVTQSDSGFASGTGGIGRPVLDSFGGAVSGMGYFAADTFARGGFDSLVLSGTVAFSGPVSIDARRSIIVAMPSSSGALNGGVISADAAVTLKAPYVALGKPFLPPLQSFEQSQFSPYVDGLSQPFLFPPTYGSGSLTVVADLIDVGYLSLQNIGEASLIAAGGDIRGNGALSIAGRLNLEAGQIYPTTLGKFTITAFDYVSGGNTLPGTVTIEGSGVSQPPLSAGGTLSIYSSVITQGGTLRAPIGTINLGWDGTGTAPKDPISGQNVPVTQQLTLTADSVTSVSAVDPRTGEGFIIPYGVNPFGNAWIDPSGFDITAGGGPAKAINLGAQSLTTQAGSVIDISGGGDLYSYQFVKGNGGSTDILASSSSFAVMPSYEANFMPYAAFSTSTTAVTNLNNDPGYVNNTLSVGDRIFLDASPGLAAGTYTLLPARYALLPGAFLVTPQNGTPIGTFAMPDGSMLVNGYRFNDLNSSRTVPAIYSRFEVANSTVIHARAQYEDFYANAFLRESAIKLDQKVPRLPMDGGYLLFSASQAMVLQGSVNARGATGGRGGLVDISSPIDIVIAGSGVSGGPGTLTLDSSLLNSYGADSILIGGFRTFGSGSATVTVRTNNLTVNNSGTPLVGPEIILVANQNLTLAPGSSIVQSGSLSDSSDVLLLGDEAVPGSGDGTLLRVSSDMAAQIIRSGVTSSNVPNFTVGAGVLLSGGSLILDSTAGMSLDPTVTLDGDAISLNAGRISMQLNSPGALQPNPGLILTGGVLQSIQLAEALSLLSYSSLDIYGTGQISTGGTLALHAAEIRGFNNGGGTVTFAAPTILLDNAPGRPSPGSVDPLSGTLVFDANVITIGVNQLNIDQFAMVNMNASGGVLMQGAGGLATQGDLNVATPLLTGARGATQSLVAAGALNLTVPVGASPMIAGGLGASLSLSGASVFAGSDIVLPSGLLTMRAISGNLVIGGRLDVSGTAQTFYDQVRYTDGGQISLTSETGSVNVLATGSLNVAAQAGGGNAGTLNVSAAAGAFNLAGMMAGGAGTGGTSGVFSLDVGSLPALAALNNTLDGAAFTLSRSLRVRTGNVLVDGVTTAKTFNLSADQGSITVSGTIDASGMTGGTINLIAWDNVTLQNGSVLTVAAQNFSNAGKGGAISLESGASVFSGGVYGAGPGGVLDIQTGSLIDLSVAANTGTSASFGQFTGTLHLRAPQNVAGTNLSVNPINGTIIDPSSIQVEGYRVFTPAGGTITTAVQTTIRNSLNIFGANIATITNNLLVNNAGLDPMTVVMPGAEVVNRTGDITLGGSALNSSSDWNLATFRFGPKNAPGVLTMRAGGNLVFFNALHDGFNITNPLSAYTAQLLSFNAALPTNTQSWSYRLAAGADFTAADFHRVQSISVLDTTFPTRGSLQLGKNGGLNTSSTTGLAATTASAVNAGTGRFQVIRTGTGDIDIAVGRDVQLLNQFASIYTVGVIIPDATMGGTFALPSTTLTGTSHGNLGTPQQSPAYPAQYTLGGGNVTIQAGGDIIHQTRNSSNVLIADSERELPMNWLYRRGYVDPITGRFGNSRYGEVASTTWWVDFSNFFEGVGALGGGNVTLIAGRDVTNVDGLVPTNARMAGKTSGGVAIAPDDNNLVELGGGDLLVKAGRNIDGGVYYIEKGTGVLNAGGSVKTNSTRTPSRGILANPNDILASETWLPTTLFLGKGGFDVKARGDLLLGPVVNPFLLPQGYSNSYFNKTYFSTYAPTSYVNATSLGGAITLRESITFPTVGTVGTPVPILQAFMQREHLLVTSGDTSASNSQPWLRLAEDSVAPFSTVMGLMPATLRATAFSGDINLVGDITLSPSPTGTLDILAAGAFNALQINGKTTLNSTTVNVWTSGTINLSDADPTSIAGIATPFAYQSLVGITPAAARSSISSSLGLNFLSQINILFSETGSTTGSAAVIQKKQALHDSELLHTGDSDPLRIYAGTGDISGLTLFSGKQSRIIAGRDVTDIAFYLQNVDDSDVTVVSSGRDIVAYNVNSPLRLASLSAGNTILTNDLGAAGDIQISGPGTLEVLAGRNLDLGSGANNADGTGVGITSIGNGRNPFLPFEGADIIAAAGLGSSGGFDGGLVNFDTFIDEILRGPNGARYFAEYAAANSGTSITSVEELDQLPVMQRNAVALDLFYLTLRDAGRDYATTGNYESGFSAITALFPDSTTGDITTRSRDIRTKSGGNISLIMPGGGLALQTANTGNTLVPPGIITEYGGNINIFANTDVNIGISRIFTLRGGNIMIWSSTGDIAAGASSKTVASAPPTRVLIDPQSADIATDLAGLATGGGIGVLATVKNVPPGNVDLIAPMGTVDAGDAGIRASGNLTIAANAVLNASNIAVAGSSSGTPTAPSVAAPNIGGMTSASNTAGASNSAADAATSSARPQDSAPMQDLPSIITVEVIGYGGGSGNDEDEEEEKRRRKKEQELAPSAQ